MELNTRSSRPALALLSASTLACLLAGCSPEHKAKPPARPPEVNVVTARQSSVPVTIDLPGRLSPYLVAQVRARVDGIVQKRSFQEGADVHANQVLYQIDPAPYRAALSSAEATLQKAVANLAAMKAQADRYKVLIDGNAVSKQALDNAIAAQGQAAADVAAARAAIATAKINLGYTTVVAPITGRSSLSQVTQGAYVQGSAATLLTTIQQIDPIYVDLTQPSLTGLQMRSDAASGKLSLNDMKQVKVSLTLEDGSIYPLSGALQFNGVTVDPATGSVTVRAVFRNPKFVLLPGMFVHAGIQTGVNHHAMLVPIPGVSHDAQGKSTVLLVGADNKVVQRSIQTEGTSGTDWIVTGGLNEGERVIVNGLQKAQPGTLVNVVAAAAAAAPAAAPAAASSSTSAPAAATPAAAAQPASATPQPGPAPGAGAAPAPSPSAADAAPPVKAPATADSAAGKTRQVR